MSAAAINETAPVEAVPNDTSPVETKIVEGNTTTNDAPSVDVVDGITVVGNTF